MSTALPTPNQKVGQYFGLYLSQVSSPDDYFLVACLNNKGFKVANKVIDGTTDCGPNYLAGFPNSTVACKGMFNFAPGADISGGILFDIAQARTSHDWIIQPIDTPVTGDYSWAFTGFISNYANDFNTDQPVDFALDIQVQGVITQSPF